MRLPFLNRYSRRPRIAVLELIREAFTGIIDRPGRSILTMLGTVLGSAAVVSIVGISQTAGSQIDARFDRLEATQVTVTDVATKTANTPGMNFPADSEARINRLNGVTASGLWWTVTSHDGTATTRAVETPEQAVPTPIYAATPGIFTASGASLVQGAVFNQFHEQGHQPVAVLSEPIAAQLGISTLTHRPAVFLDGRPFTVIGIISTPQRVPSLGLGIIIPATTAEDLFGLPAPSDPATMLITTRIGAAALIATQAPWALDPFNPGNLNASPPPNIGALRDQVHASVNGLLLALADVYVVVGALGIANTTMVAVLERRGEIGLRRALGARRRHIAEQFLIEAAALGFLGGLFGTATGVAATIVVSLIQDWTAVMTPLVFFAPVMGAVTGMLAGIYPSLRAAWVEPVTALRDA